jgi:hypothetical protein
MTFGCALSAAGILLTAVTTGTVPQQAAGAEKNPAIQQIVNKIVHAAYGAFGHGLDLALMAAGALMIGAALVSSLTLGVRRPPSVVSRTGSDRGRVPAVDPSVS